MGAQTSAQPKPMDHEQENRAASGARPSPAHQLPHFFHGDAADCDHQCRAIVWWHGDGDAYGSRFLHACTMSRGEKFVPGPAPSVGSPLLTAHRVVMPWLSYSWTEVDLALMLAWSPAEWTKSQAPWQWRSHKKRGLEQLRNSNPRVALLCFPTTADALSQLSASWLEEPKSCCPDLPLVLVGLRPAAATTERITKEEAMAAAGGAASAYYECTPESWAGCDELVQAIVRLGLSLTDDVAVMLPEVLSRSASKPRDCMGMGAMQELKVSAIFGPRAG